MNDNPEADNLNQENNNQNNQNNNEEENHDENSFFSRISSKDVMSITSDFFPSVVFIGFIGNALVSTETFCSNGFSTILKAMLFIYAAFVIKALFHTILIIWNNQNADFSKISLSTMDFILNLAYYVAVLVGYFIYRARPDECFMANTFPTILLFVLILIGIINLSRHGLNLLMIILCFPIMVYYFLRNPQSFYSNIGIDPEIVRNLPTIKADLAHTGSCAVCIEDILEGQEILILRCPGKHFFHANCIKPWLIQKVACPTCRNENVL